MRVLYWPTADEAYTCDAAVIGCFDARFELPLRRLCKRLRLERPDLIKIGGGPRLLASSSERDREILLHQLRLSASLHETRRVVLVAHADCGAYRAELAKREPNIERGLLERDLQRAAAAVIAALPQQNVTKYVLDFAGAARVE